MAEPAEEPDRDALIDELVARSAAVWPRTDAELDRWLASQALAPEDRSWIETVVRRRIEEARGALPATPVAAGVETQARDRLVTVASEAPVKAEKPVARLSADDLAVLDRQLLELVEARVPLPEGLRAYAADMKNGKLGRVLDALRQDLEAGQPLSQAIERRGDALPPIYRALVAAGEASGDLTGILALLARQAETDAEIGRRFREALAYPVVTISVTMSIAYLVFANFVPGFRPIFETMNVELPRATEWALDVSEFFGAHPFATPLAALAVGFAAIPVGRASARRFFPNLSLRTTRLRRLAEIARALAGFLGRGVPASTAFRALDASFSEALPAGTLGRVADRLEGGASISAALRPERAFPATFVWLVGTAEARKTLPDTLLEIAKHYERQFDRWMKFLEALLPPLTLVGVGFLVGGLVLGMFLPIFKLQSALMQ